MEKIMRGKIERTESLIGQVVIETLERSRKAIVIGAVGGLMNKETLYLDTSIPGAYHDSEKPRRQRRTWEFWEKLPLYEVKTSQVTVVEISRIAEPEMRRKTLSLIFVPEIEIYQVLEEDNDLADEYLEFGIFPYDERDDALHVAIATIRGLNYLVSWNHDHIVEENTRRCVYELNAVRGYVRVAH